MFSPRCSETDAAGGGGDEDATGAGEAAMRFQRVAGGTVAAAARGMMRLGTCVVGLALAVAACEPTYSMTDDVDLTWDFTLTPRRFGDNLHSPFVRGAGVTVFAHSSNEKESLQGWSIESSDPEVFRIDEAVPS